MTLAPERLTPKKTLTASPKPLWVMWKVYDR